MTHEDKWNIAKAIFALIWRLLVLFIAILCWVHIVDGIVHKDYMKTIAYASVFMLVKMNELEERL